MVKYRCNHQAVSSLDYASVNKTAALIDISKFKC